MKKNIFLILIIAVIFTSCRNISKKNNDIEVIEIPKIDSFLEKPNLESVIDTTFAIQLDTNDKAILGDITKVEIKDKKVFVFDLFSQILLEFNLKGEFIREIGVKGRGPEEYKSMDAFILDGDKIIINDSVGRKIIEYNIENGEFIRTIPIELYTLEFYGFNSNTYIANIHNYHQADGKKDYSIAFVDKTNMKITKKLKSINKIARLVTTYSISGDKNTDFYFHQPYSHFIYKISETQEIEKAYKIDFKDRSIPEKTLQENAKKEDSRKLAAEINRKKFAFVMYVHVKDNNVILPVNKGEKNYNFLYSLNTKKAYLINNNNSIDNELDKLFLSYGSIVGSNGDFIISHIDPGEFFSENKKENIINSTKFTKKISRNDNPILILTKFRKDI